MTKVPNAVEILPKIWTTWVGRRNVTDRQTTDGRVIAYSEREREKTQIKTDHNQKTLDHVYLDRQQQAIMMMTKRMEMM